MLALRLLLVGVLVLGCHPVKPEKSVPTRPEPTPKVVTPVEVGELSFQDKRWVEAQLRPDAILKLDKLVFLYQRNKERYDAIQGLVAKGAPSTVIFGIHYRESDNDFSTHLANGDPLTHRTFHVPKGRIPNIDPPYTFEQGAADAIYKVDRLDLVNWKERSHALQAIEAYNGLGYQQYHSDVNSPYMYSGTNLYERGKYKFDARFDPLAVDKQLGVVAILKRMQEKEIELPF